ncbi:site-2 protease family protein [Pseudomonas veronii]|uniref:site-2 protease family protein n=1 Tax=Pseudomonas veronii TaxID=76761 RepID=UPI000625ED07|nr:site-2 protease family protein [Pseudomonas veronii]
MLLTIGMFIAAFAVIWLMLVFLLLIHESGHLMPMQKMGIKPDKLIIGGVKLFSFRKSGIIHEVGLIPLWAYVVSKDYENATSHQRAIIAAGGPLISALTGILFFGIYYLYPNWQTLVAAQGSILLAVTNIIPLPPLDGWTIAEHFLKQRGIHIDDRNRKILLGIGIGTICLITLAL